MLARKINSCLQHHSKHRCWEQQRWPWRWCCCSWIVSDLFQIDAEGFDTESPLTSDPGGSGELQLMSMCYARKIFLCCTIIQVLSMYIC